MTGYGSVTPKGCLSAGLAVSLAVGLLAGNTVNDFVLKPRFEAGHIAGDGSGAAPPDKSTGGTLLSKVRAQITHKADALQKRGHV